MMFGRNVFRGCSFAVLLMSSLVVPAAASDIDPQSPHIGSHVRGAKPQINKLIARGIKGSPTFAKLVDELNKTDVIVYIEVTNRLPPGLDGRLAFMSSAGPLRYLHAQIREGMGFETTIATAGHELQHALEIAAAPSVRDSATMATLYRLIGVGGVDQHHRYDTVAARVTGRRVRQELS